MEKQKIAILGGGMSSLSAAHELTNYEGWDSYYDITIYQMGWRLGGKCSMGRGVKDRVEEHGLHILVGFYDNVFRLIQNVYAERKKYNLDPRSPLQTWRDGFDTSKCNSTILTQFSPSKGKWEPWSLVFPFNDLTPGEGEPPSFWHILKSSMELLFNLVVGNSTEYSQYIPESFRNYLEGHLKGLIENLTKINLDSHNTQEIQNFIRNIQKVAERATQLLRLLKNVDDRIYRLWSITELVYINLKGVFEDVYIEQEQCFDFEKINHLDYRAWLSQHGAAEEITNGALVRFLYLATFAVPKGDYYTNGAVAAGTAIEYALLSLQYKGAYIWQFIYGAADVMVSPLYQVLKNKGVKFKFFHKVEQVHYSATDEIESITIGEQVELITSEYQPFIEVRNVQTWPKHPLYEQINPEQAKKLIAENIDLESAWTSWQNVNTKVLKKGEDFDHVILGIPVTALKTICSELVAKNERWKNMVERVQTLATANMQLWLKPTLKELGMDVEEWGLPAGTRPNTVIYAMPLYSWIDQTPITGSESWDFDNFPQLLVYVEGVFPDPLVIPPFSDHDYPQRAKEKLKNIAEQWLNFNMGFFWKKATTPQMPQSLNFDLLVGTEKGMTGIEKFYSQFFTANINPSDRYTMSAPNTAQFRMKTNESGYKNLFLTGDWINFGLNAGYVEGTVISGLQAAQALRKSLGLDTSQNIWTGLKESKRHK